MFIQEIAEVKATSSSSGHADAYLEELNLSVARILSIMEDFTPVLPIMGPSWSFFHLSMFDD